MANPSQTQNLFIKRLSNDAVIPTRGTNDSAGYDLSSAHDIVICAKGKGLVKTDLAMCIPEGCYGRIAPRSGFSWKNHADIGAGVIDRDYRGNVGVVIFNHSDRDIEVKKGDRVAQLILERVSYAAIQECPMDTELPQSDRGQRGYGSTGV